MYKVEINIKQIEEIYNEAKETHRTGRSGGYGIDVYYDLDAGNAWWKPVIEGDNWHEYDGDVIRVVTIWNPWSMQHIIDEIYEAVNCELSCRQQMAL